MTSQRIRLRTLLHLARRDLFRHPAGGGSESKLRQFVLNRYAAVVFLLAIILMVPFSWVVIGIGEGMRMRYDAELDNPFIWWFDARVERAAGPARGGLSSEEARKENCYPDGSKLQLPRKFWTNQSEYNRKLLDLGAKGAAKRPTRGRTVRASDPALVDAGRKGNLIWPDPSRFESWVNQKQVFGIVLSSVLYEDLLGEVAESESIEKRSKGGLPLIYANVSQQSERLRNVPIPVLGVARFLPGGEFLIGQWFAEAELMERCNEGREECADLAKRELERRFYPHEFRLGFYGVVEEEAAKQEFYAVEECLGDRFLRMPDTFPQAAFGMRVEVKGDARLPLGEVMGVAQRCGVFSRGWQLVQPKLPVPLRMERQAYVLKHEPGETARAMTKRVEEMMEFCETCGLDVDAELVSRAGSLAEGRRVAGFLSDLLLWLNALAAGALLVLLVTFKTHRDVAREGAYLAAGGRAWHGYAILVIQFVTSFLLFSLGTVGLGALATLLGTPSLDGVRVIGDVSFAVFTPMHIGWIGSVGLVSLMLVLVVRFIICGRMLPAQMMRARS